MKHLIRNSRLVLVVLIGTFFAMPVVSAAHASSVSVIRGCINKSNKSIVISSTCSKKTQTAISWKSDGPSSTPIKTCVSRATLVMKWTASDSCGSQLLVQWTTEDVTGTKMTVCVNKKTKVMSYAPVDWCSKNFIKLSWSRTIATPTTTTTSSTTTTTSTSSTTTSTLAHNGNYVGVQLGSNTDDGILDMVVDSTGMTYSAGYTLGIFPGAQVIGDGSGASTVFVSKHTATNQLLWTKQLNFNAGTDSGVVALTPTGSLLVGTTTTIGSTKDVVISKFSADGTNVWNQTIGSAGWDYITSIDVDSSNNIYVSGQTSGDFLDPLINDVNNLNVFVAKYHLVSEVLQPLWISVFGSSKQDYVTGMTLLPNGSVAICGTTRGVMPNSGANAPTNYSFDAGFVSQLDSTGNVAWTKQWTGADYLAMSGVSIDATGALYATGHSFSNLRSLSSRGFSLDGFVVKLSPLDGSTTWSRMFGSTDADFAYGIAPDTDGSMVVGGYTDGSPAGKTLSRKYHPFVVKVDPAGNFAWLTEAAVSGTNHSYVWTITNDPRGGVVLGGESYLNFGGPNIDTTNSTSDALFIRITSQGELPSRHN